jgi:hypothetical protein
MKPIIHFVVGDCLLREELKKLFSKHNNVIVDNSNILNMNYNKTLYVSLTSCLLSSIMKTHLVYFEFFKHNNILEEKIKEVGTYNNIKELLLQYNKNVTIQVEKQGENNYILYIPIKYSYTSKLPITHLYNAFEIIHQEAQKYQVNFIVIPLDSIIHFNLNDSINQYIANTIYNATKYLI